MDFKELSNYSRGKVHYYIYDGISNDIDNLKNGVGAVEKKDLEELLNWYKDNVMISYNSLKEKFDKVVE
ncbi:hypothetical protein [Clostridium butyricum]|uniref:hypothetical protein n=1 Tax=Clostridium butyricum TaxID=1492 RepID=UPI0012B89D27|nr:hypothetical protein [Clostridium butyricum]